MYEEARVLMQSRRCHMFFHVGVKPLRRRGCWGGLPEVKGR